MKIAKIGELEIVMQNDLSKHNYFAWPTAKRLQNGRIAVTASGFRRRHVCPFGKTVIAFSDDEGKKYTLPYPVIDTVLDDRDGGIATFGKSGVIVTSFNNTTAFQKNYPYSDAYDHAYLDTVSAEEETEALGASFCISNDYGVTFGKRFKSPITSPHGPIELQNGTILWVGTVYVSNGVHEENTIKAYKINLDGTMELVGQIEDVCVDGEHVLSCEPHAIQLEDGTIVVHIRAQKYGEQPNAIFTLFQTESHDNGKTWSKPKQLLSRAGGAPAHLFKLSTGELISTFSYRKAPCGIKVIISTDDGKTWCESKDIFVSDGDFWDIGYPSTVELNDGTLLTVFYLRPSGNKPAKIVQQRWKIEK